MTHSLQREGNRAMADGDAIPAVSAGAALQLRRKMNTRKQKLKSQSNRYPKRK
jgi:hypothetical protein